MVQNFPYRWWAYARETVKPDQLVQSLIGPQSVPPLSVTVASTALVVNVVSSNLDVSIASNGTCQVTVLANPILNN